MALFANESRDNRYGEKAYLLARQLNITLEPDVKISSLGDIKPAADFYKFLQENAKNHQKAAALGEIDNPAEDKKKMRRKNNTAAVDDSITKKAKDPNPFKVFVTGRDTNSSTQPRKFYFSDTFQKESKRSLKYLRNVRRRDLRQSSGEELYELNLMCSPFAHQLRSRALQQNLDLSEDMARVLNEPKTNDKDKTNVDRKTSLNGAATMALFGVAASTGAHASSSKSVDHLRATTENILQEHTKKTKSNLDDMRHKMNDSLVYYSSNDDRDVRDFYYVTTNELVSRPPSMVRRGCTIRKRISIGNLHEVSQNMNKTTQNKSPQ